MKKPVLIFTVADQNHFEEARKMLTSLSKFHDPKEVDTIIITNLDPKEALAKLPKGVKIADLNPYIKDDPAFFYRQKPIIGEEYIDDYELVLGLDSDQIILGDLNYIFNRKD